MNIMNFCIIMQEVFEEIFEGKNINAKAEGNEPSAKYRLEMNIIPNNIFELPLSHHHYSNKLHLK